MNSRSLIFILLTACQAQVTSMGTSNPEESPIGGTSPELRAFTGFQCQPGLSSSGANALQKYTAVEFYDRIRIIILQMVPNATVAQQIWNRMNDLQISTIIPSERSGQYDRNTESGFLNQTTINALYRVAAIVATQIRGNATWFQNFAGICATANPPTAQCLRAYLSRLLPLALTSPVTSGNLDEITSLLQGHPSDWFQASLTYSFLSAASVNRVETGSGSVEGGWIALSDLELVHRLASIFWMGSPDGQLRAWVSAGEVRGRYEQVIQYVLSHQRFELMMQNFAERYLQLDQIREVRFDTSTAATNRLNHYGLSSLRDISNYSQLARDEAIHFFMESLRSGLSFNQLFLSDAAYTSGDFATAQGTAPWTSGDPSNYESNTKKGLLSLSSIHLNSGTEKNHIHAGYQILKMFLCGSVPSPESANISPAQLVIPAPKAGSSSRERTTQLTSRGICMNCHSQIDHLGFAVSNIDSMGVYRAEERIYDSAGLLLGTLPIDSSVSFRIGARQVSTSNLGDFAEVLLSTDYPQACFARHFFRHAFGRLEQLNGEEACALESLYLKIKDPNLSLKEALSEFARSKFFRERYVGGNP